MKRLYIAIFALSAILLGVAGKSTKGVLAPDRLFLIEGKMFVANRAANQLARLSADGKSIEEKVKTRTFFFVDKKFPEFLITNCHNHSPPKYGKSPALGRAFNVHIQLPALLQRRRQRCYSL